MPNIPCQNASHTYVHYLLDCHLGSTLTTTAFWTCLMYSASRHMTVSITARSATYHRESRFSVLSGLVQLQFGVYFFEKVSYKLSETCHHSMGFTFLK